MFKHDLKHLAGQEKNDEKYNNVLLILIRRRTALQSMPAGGPYRGCLRRTPAVSGVATTFSNRQWLE